MTERASRHAARAASYSSFALLGASCAVQSLSGVGVAMVCVFISSTLSALVEP